MKIIATEIPDLYVIEPSVFTDSRGYFFESYSSAKFAEKGLTYHWVQDNESKSNRGVVRGFHYQLNPYAQAKLVRVIVGEVIDAVIDIRQDSPTYGQKFEILLSAENKRQLLIPRGFAHGFSVLKDGTVFSYKCDNFYHKESERSINPFDPALNIDWKISESEALLSEKDKQSPVFADVITNFQYNQI